MKLIKKAISLVSLAGALLYGGIEAKADSNAIFQVTNSCTLKWNSMGT